MKLLITILCLLPIFLFGNTSTLSKYQLAHASMYHVEEANFLITLIRQETRMIPDLSDRELMETVIESAICALVSPTIKTKILAMGLPLIGKLISIHGYRHWSKMQTMLYQLEHHIEMSKFYNLLSYKCTKEYGEADEEVQTLILYLDALTFSVLFSEVIKDPAERHQICNYINSHRMVILNLLEKPNYDFSVQDFDECYTFWENLFEAVANIESSPRQVGEIICRDIRKATMYLGKYMIKAGKIKQEDYEMDFGYGWTWVGEPPLFDPLGDIKKPTCYFELIFDHYESIQKPASYFELIYEQ